MAVLGNLVEQIRGVSYKPEDLHALLNDNSVTLLRANNIKDGRLNFDDVVYVDKKKVSDKQFLKAGDILICTSSGSKELVGKAAYVDCDLEITFGAFCKVVRPKVGYSKYIGHFFNSPFYRERISNSAAGANINNIRNEHIDALEIVWPSLDEQKDVVVVLDRVSELIALRKEQLAKLDQLVKSRFVELFGKENYSSTPLIELIVEGAGLSYGIIVPGDNVEDGVPMIRPSDFINDNLCLDNVYRVAPEIEAKYVRTRLIGDEILVQVIGQPGQIMMSDIRCKGMNVTRNLAVVRPDCNRINRIYLKTYMQTQEAQAFMLGETKQSTLKQLPLSRLKELKIPVPPMELQNQFAAFVEQTNKTKLTIQSSLDKLEVLKKSLMQEYFG